MQLRVGNCCVAPIPLGGIALEAASLLSGHQLRSVLVYPINSASFLPLSLPCPLVGMERESALTRRDWSKDVFGRRMWVS